MSISSKNVNYLSNLARIKLTEQESLILSEQLQEILNFVDKLTKLDVEGVNPTANILDLKNILRDDKIKDSLNHEEVLKITSHKKGDFFQVPKVID